PPLPPFPTRRSSDLNNLLVPDTSTLHINNDVDAGAGAIGLFGSGGGIVQNGGHLAGVNMIADIAGSFPSGSIALTGVANAISGKDRKSTRLNSSHEW